MLATAAEEIGAGRLDTPIEVKGKDEIARLAASFQTMAEQIKESFATLEQKVADRTRTFAPFPPNSANGTSCRYAPSTPACAAKAIASLRKVDELCLSQTRWTCLAARTQEPRHIGSL